MKPAREENLRPHCPTPDIVAAAERLVADRVAQGLPARVSDPSVLAQIASLLQPVGEAKVDSKRPRRAA